MADTLKDKTARGLFWGAMNNGSTQVLNLVFGIVLARLLTPSDYGIVGVLTIFTTLAGDMQSAGFTQALINLKVPTDRDYNSVFSFTVCMSLAMYALLLLSAPLIADFFHQPVLTSVSRLVFLTFVVSSLGIAPGGYMTKNMMNREMAVIGVVALLCSGTVGIALAWMGCSYWALAWQQLSYITVVNLGRYHYVRQWRPRLTLDFGPVRRMAPFALKILVTKIINTISNNVLTIIFGRLYPMHQVGNYSQAYKWNTMAHTMVSNSLGQVAQTVLVEADKPGGAAGGERSLRVFRKMLRFTAFVSMPLMMGLALVGREFIVLAIGEKWLDCVPMLQVLCLSGAFMPIYIMYQNLAISHGRSDLFMWLNIGQIVLQIAVIVAFRSFGMQAMLCAYSLFLVLWLLPWHHFCAGLIGYKWMEMLRDLLPFALVAAAVMGLVYLLTRSLSAPLLLLLLRVAMAALLYYAVMKLLRVKILQECEQYCRRLCKRHKE